MNYSFQPHQLIAWLWVDPHFGWRPTKTNFVSDVVNGRNDWRASKSAFEWITAHVDFTGWGPESKHMDFAIDENLLLLAESHAVGNPVDYDVPWRASKRDTMGQAIAFNHSHLVEEENLE